MHLEHTISVFNTYPTHVEICVVTDNGPALNQVLRTWDLPNPVEVWYGFSTSAYHSNKYKILFEHRNVLRKASAKAYSTYIYVEDDTRVPWPVLVSWAWDTEVLEPMVGWTGGQ